jgi:hypothetical protein
MRQPKLFIEGEPQKMLSYNLSLKKQQLRLVAEMFSQRQHLNIGSQKETLDRHREEIFAFYSFSRQVSGTVSIRIIWLWHYSWGSL